MGINVDKSYFRERLENCKSYGEIFEVVKKVVKEVLGLRRVGLLLYLEDLPPHIGAYHQIGSNGIVLNRWLLNIMSKSLMSKTEFNSLIFSLLLHEYIHTLGFLDEKEVRRLVYEISLNAFGEGHPAVRMAMEPPLISAPTKPFEENLDYSRLEIVKDFERIEHSYII
ncbi:hypothetical protein KEJ34_01895 [Candidatus Bathyarchaeota archaeon]|nr:hypothetical protein [Candidatus Bathyarchaeota archaeon]